MILSKNNFVNFNRFSIIEILYFLLLLYSLDTLKHVLVFVKIRLARTSLKFFFGRGCLINFT